MLLQVTPHLRPNCEKLLSLPIVLKRLQDKHLLEPDEGRSILLKTIKVPKKFQYLTDLLPKPNYSMLKLKKIDKNKFVQTVAGIKSIKKCKELFKKNSKAVKISVLTTLRNFY